MRGKYARKARVRMAVNGLAGVSSKQRTVAEILP